MPEDRFLKHATSRTSPGTRHWLIVPNDSLPLDPRPRALYARSAGVVMLRDEVGTVLTYTLAAGELLPFSATAVLATGTSATLYGWD